MENRPALENLCEKLSGVTTTENGGFAIHADVWTESQIRRFSVLGVCFSRDHGFCLDLVELWWWCWHPSSAISWYFQHIFFWDHINQTKELLQLRFSSMAKFGREQFHPESSVKWIPTNKLTSESKLTVRTSVALRSRWLENDLPFPFHKHTQFAQIWVHYRLRPSMIKRSSSSECSSSSENPNRQEHWLHQTKFHAFSFLQPWLSYSGTLSLRTLYVGILNQSQRP